MAAQGIAKAASTAPPTAYSCGQTSPSTDRRSSHLKTEQRRPRSCSSAIFSMGPTFFRGLASRPTLGAVRCSRAAGDQRHNRRLLSPGKSSGFGSAEVAAKQLVIIDPATPNLPPAARRSLRPGKSLRRHGGGRSRDSGSDGVSQISRILSHAPRSGLRPDLSRGEAGRRRSWLDRAGRMPPSPIMLMSARLVVGREGYGRHSLLRSSMTPTSAMATQPRRSSASWGDRPSSARPSSRPIRRHSLGRLK